MTKTRSLTPERAGKGDFSPQHSLHAFGLMTRFPVWCRLGSGHSVSPSSHFALRAPPPSGTAPTPALVWRLDFRWVRSRAPGTYLRSYTLIAYSYTPYPRARREPATACSVVF